VAWTAALEAQLRAQGALLLHGGAWDRWDIEARFGTLGSARLRVAVEEHGQGRQLVRVHAWPRASALILAVSAVFGSLALVAGLDGAGSAALALLAIALTPFGLALYDACTALGAVRLAARGLRGSP
jgi:hypothetical protein